MNYGVYNYCKFCCLNQWGALCVFKASRGSLSPLLFLLVMEGMGKMISATQSRGSFSCLGITRNIFITHLIFVDDVLIFGNIYVIDWHVLQKIIGHATCI